MIKTENILISLTFSYFYAIVQQLKFNKAQNMIDWSVIDWQKQNSAIAEELNISRERVRQVRKKLGKPRALNHHKKRNTLEKDFLALDTDNKTRKQIAEELGCNPAYVSHLICKYNRDVVRIYKRHDWQSLPRKIYETVPDKKIAEMLNMNRPLQVLNWRLNHGIHKTYKWKRGRKKHV